ncbi:hypothetical protein DL1_05585 [Thioclava dalianensis]|uniref:Lipoprotein n=1 Tax=Thioclava dalianensis TaxID=1185766 RepID=A0A074TJ71_9RHOB|nr:hypothetical protein [Thioclava dalianensis]KEP69063.1 hypothetical protein DL1_05585 [Thioclava dalianensis]SFM83652.1 hypothetical protein SAMN05216224_101540 [Thioclava dalianensis]
MSRCLILCVLSLGLWGCGASPAPQFFGAARYDITLEGIAFTVFVSADRAEVIRRGYLRREERDRVPPLMERAAEQASGCKVAGPLGGWARSPSLPGDTGEGRYQLDCG